MEMSAASGRPKLKQLSWLTLIIITLAVHTTSPPESMGLAHMKCTGTTGPSSANISLQHNRLRDLAGHKSPSGDRAAQGTQAVAHISINQWLTTCHQGACATEFYITIGCLCISGQAVTVFKHSLTEHRARYTQRACTGLIRMSVF
eukprot:jgi/Ulvmu1/11550/UM078_0041.1